MENNKHPKKHSQLPPHRQHLLIYHYLQRHQLKYD